ncbi:MAG: toll/interleukin-1 receptor domain-containing protein [Fuerstiella sp.]
MQSTHDAGTQRTHAVATESTGAVSGFAGSVRAFCSQLRSLYRRLMVWWLGYDFFISYCHESESYAKGLYDSLSRKYVCFLDRAPEGIQAGETVGDSISAALKKSRILVVVWSPAVATNEWPRAECRFFAAVRPDRRLIPISPAPYSSDLPQILFASELQMLQDELERWIQTVNSVVPESFVPDGQQLAIVEGGLADLRGSTPSSETLTKLLESYDGTSVPTTARRIMCAVYTVLLGLSIGLWMYYAGGVARQVVEQLQQNPYGTAGVSEVQDASTSEFLLRAIVRDRQVAAAARAHKLSDAEEWRRLCQLLNDYHYYQWWSCLGFGYDGIALEIHGLPDLLETPAAALPEGIVDLRIYAQQLPDDWITLLKSKRELKLLSISVDTLETPESLAAILGELSLSELRLSKCRDFTRQWLAGLNKQTRSGLNTLYLSQLPELKVQAAEDEDQFTAMLLNCRHLNKLTLDQLWGCRFSDNFFQVLLQKHPSLCDDGSIKIDPDTILEGAILRIDAIPGCTCKLEVLDFPDL